MNKIEHVLFYVNEAETALSRFRTVLSFISSFISHGIVPLLKLNWNALTQHFSGLDLRSTIECHESAPSKSRICVHKIDDNKPSTRPMFFTGLQQIRI